jgi:FixJ family two-component response regulator
MHSQRDDLLTAERERMSATATKTICIVDDDEAVRDSLSLLLKSGGLATRSYDSADAFLRAGAQDMACLILDLHMPGTSGLELLRLLRRRGLSQPVFVVSGRRDPLLDAEVHAAGATNLLSKPFDDQTLLNLVLGAVAA